MLISCNKIPNKKKSALLKKTSDFSFALVDSVYKINADHWNTIVPHGSEFLELPFLNVLEKESPENMRFHYAIIYRSGKPAAITYFQVIDFSSESFGSMVDDESKEFTCVITDYLKKYLTNHIKRSADKINMRLLICGNAYVSGEHGFTCLPEINKTEVVDALADVIYLIGRAEKLRGNISAVLIKDFYSDSLGHAAELEEYKYHDFLVEPNMIVDVQWDSFDEYLNAMSKKYRNRAKTILKKGIAIERKVLDADDIEKNSKRLLQLFNNVHLKAKFRLASLTPGYFAELKRTMGDKFNFVAYYHSNQLVGFRSTFMLKNAVEAHFIGLDYTVNKELELYQNILYDYIQEAIDNKKQQVFLGRTASEIKSTVGAEAYQLTCYIRHRNSLSNRIIKPFVDYLKPSEWVPRNPFKEISV
jgi:predicted N-acyltransferase